MKLISHLIHCLAAAAIVLIASPVMAEEPYEIEWIQQLGTHEAERAKSVACDDSGNVYISGFTLGSLEGVSSIDGGIDAFLAKYDSSGHLLWTEQLGTSSAEEAFSVAVDNSGNAFVTGHTKGDLAGTNAGDTDAFLAKYDSSGNLLWTRQSGTANTEESQSVAVDVFGNAYISGFTKGDLGGSNLGWSDAFITKYDSSGSLLWTKQMGTDGGDIIYSLEVNESGNIIACGVTTGDLGGPNAGDTDTFVAKYDQSGNEVWTQQLGTSEREYAYSVASDGFENIYITGYTYGDLGGVNAGMKDAFLAKYDPNGNLLWTEQLGTSYEEDFLSVAVDGAGNAFVSGNTVGSLAGFNAGSWDTFVTKFGLDGELLWMEQIGTSERELAYSVAVGIGGNVYVSGGTDGYFGGINAGREDAFLIKFTVPEPAGLLMLTAGGLLAINRRRQSA